MHTQKNSFFNVICPEACGCKTSCNPSPQSASTSIGWQPLLNSKFVTRSQSDQQHPRRQACRVMRSRPASAHSSFNPRYLQKQLWSSAGNRSLGVRRGSTVLSTSRLSRPIPQRAAHLACHVQSKSCSARSARDVWRQLGTVGLEQHVLY